MNSKLSGCVIDFSPSLHLKLKEQIGSGSFSYVYTCSDPRYVVKMINSTDPKSLVSYENERTAFLALPKHENIIHCPAFRDNIILKDIKYCCLVLENCPRGSLISMIVDKNMTFQENQILQIFLDVLLGLHQMHSNSQPIAHRDLKCENVLLGEDGRFKLIDFGSISMQSIPIVNAENRDSIQDDIEKNTTPTVRAPEQCDLFSGFPINEKVDIWALGCLLYILCFQKQPFETKLSTINCQYFLNDTSKYSESILNLFPLLFQANPTQRPSTASLLDYFEQNFYTFSRPLDKPNQAQTVLQPKEREYKSIFEDIPEDYDLERHSRYKNLVRQPITRRKNKTKELVMTTLEKNKNSLDEKSLERMVIKSWQKPEKIKEIYSVIHQIAVQKQENIQMSLKILMLVHRYLIMCPSTVFLQELPKRISYPNDILMFVNQRWKLLFENDISSSGDKECNAYFSTFLSEYSGLLNHKVILHTQYSNTFEGNFSFDPLLLKNTEHDDSLINDSILWDILNYLKRILQFSKIIMLTNDMKETQSEIASIVFEEGFNLISSLSHITAGLKAIASQMSTLDDLVVENNFQRFETQFEICYKDFRELLENKDFDFVKNLTFELPVSITQQIKTILNATREKEQQSPLMGEIDAKEAVDCFKIPSSFSKYRDIKGLDEIEAECDTKQIKSNALKPSLDQENQPKCIIEHLPLKQKDPNQGTERQKKKIFEHIPETANKEQKPHDLFMMMFNDKKPDTNSALKDKTNIMDKTPNAIWENIFHVQSSDSQNKIDKFTENPKFKMPASLKTYSQDISTKFSEYLIPYHELVLNQSETRKNHFHASWREKGIVLRKFELAHLLMDHKEEFERKLLALTQISQHSNLANFLGISLNNSEIYVIYEQFTGSSLFEWLDSNKDFVLSWNQKAKIALGYASALHHLHSCNFSFFNEPLKPLRPLMTSPKEYDNQDLLIKFENLDIEVSKEQTHQTRKELMRTFGLMAPETFVCKSSGVKADVFTFSILLWKVLAREEPYPKLKTPIDIMKYVSIQKKRPELARIPNSCPKMLINLMTRCWAHDPQIRPSFAEIIEELEQFLKSYTAEFSP